MSTKWEQAIESLTFIRATVRGSKAAPDYYSFAITWLCVGPAKKTRAKPKAQPQTHTVTITGFKFVPETLTVNMGDTVEWKNEDIVAHTATAEGKSFDSKGIEPKASWKYVAGKQGTYPYICNFHPTMKAALMVK